MHRTEEARITETTDRSASRLARLLNWLVRLRGSPEAIARGVAISFLVAFTPTIGFQALIAVGLATLLDANRPVSLVPIWVTNPLTIPPIYAFTYWLGSLFWSGPPASEVAAAIRETAEKLRELDLLALHEPLGLFLALGLDVFVALWIGGLLVGGVAAAISYPLTLRTVTKLRARRKRARRRRAG